MGFLASVFESDEPTSYSSFRREARELVEWAKKQKGNKNFEMKVIPHCDDLLFEVELHNTKKDLTHTFCGESDNLKKALSLIFRYNEK